MRELTTLNPKPRKPVVFPLGIPPGSLKRDDVLKVLQANGVSVVPNSDNTLFTVFNERIVEVYALEDRVHRRMIHRFARRFEIPVHRFYHPEAILPLQTST